MAVRIQMHAMPERELAYSQDTQLTSAPTQNLVTSHANWHLLGSHKKTDLTPVKNSITNLDKWQALRTGSQSHTPDNWPGTRSNPVNHPYYCMAWHRLRARSPTMITDTCIPSQEFRSLRTPRQAIQIVLNPMFVQQLLKIRPHKSS